MARSLLSIGLTLVGFLIGRAVAKPLLSAEPWGLGLAAVTAVALLVIALVLRNKDANG